MGLGPQNPKSQQGNPEFLGPRPRPDLDLQTPKPRRGISGFKNSRFLFPKGPPNFFWRESGIFEKLSHKNAIKSDFSKKTAL